MPDGFEAYDIDGNCIGYDGTSLLQSVLESLDSSVYGLKDRLIRAYFGDLDYVRWHRRLLGLGALSRKRSKNTVARCYHSA